MDITDLLTQCRGNTLQRLLVHKFAMRVFAKTGIYGATRQGLARSTLASVAAFDGLLQPPAGFRVVEDFQPTIPRDVADDLGHGCEVVAAWARPTNYNMPPRGRYREANRLRLLLRQMLDPSM
jgi:hypothetical protein